MVNAETQARWDKVRDKIKSEVRPQAFDTWFTNLKLQDATDDMLTVVADSTFIINSLQSRYRTMIEGTIGLFFDKPMIIRYILPDQVIDINETIEAAHLNPHLTFDNFIVGEGNSYVHAASYAVAEAPGHAYNPLFIYGGVGLGKTHLLNAIGNYIISENPECKVLFMTSEGFTNELIDALVKKKGTAQIRAKMRNVDVLLVDDIQFLGKTNTSQEEFFHTFNDLYGKGKQIVLSSDRPPKEISMLEDRLRSRFEGGLTMDIGKPGFETRLAILKKKMEEKQTGDIPEEVLRYIAERVDTNVRELEGALQRISAEAQFKHTPVTLEMATQSLNSLVPIKDPKRITPRMISDAVGEMYGVSTDDIYSSKRARNIVEPRQIAIYLTRELTNMSTLALGKEFDRDHSTIMHACDKVTEALKSTPELERKLNTLRERIRSN